MVLQANLRAPNSLLLVVSNDRPEIPESIGPDSIVIHTSTCIVAGTVAEDDGEVAVAIIDHEVADGQLLLLDTIDLDTSAGFIAVETVLRVRILTLPVANSQCMVRLWASDRTEPDRIVVQVLDRR